MTDATYQLAHIELNTQDIPEQSIVSTTLAKSPHVKPVLFRFAAGESLSEHTSTYPAVLLFLSGRAAVTLGEDSHEVETGAWIYMPPNLPHSITAHTPVVMLLEMIDCK
ncbi:MAG: cupin domain-containing protein [Ardenticatenaceae bacterium]|nr:cupin domain-containing protein [Ardenticatenaceae bacterium]